jgi:hypothetical protein
MTGVMEKDPWREFLIGVVAPMTVALGLYYGFGLGEHFSLSHLAQKDKKEPSTAIDNPPELITFSTGNSGSSLRSDSTPQQNPQEARKHLADIEADIATRLRELRQIGIQETELGQFATPRLDTLAIDQAVKREEERARRIAAFVTAAKKRQAKLRARIIAMLRKLPSQSQAKQLMPRPDASLQELEELSAKLEGRRTTVKAMQE